MYSFQKKQQVSAVDYVINSMKTLLLRGDLKPGDKLPNEEELSALLGVSRGSIRSAMKVFSVCGVVDVRVGDGTYVCTELNSNSINPMIFPMLILQPNVESLAVFREKVECDIVELILADEGRRTETLTLLGENIQELRDLQQRHAALEAFVQNDVTYHRILGRQCGNVVFETVYNQLMEYFVPFLTASHKHQETGSAADSSHAKIYRALQNRDAEAACLAIVESNEYWQTSVLWRKNMGSAAEE